MKLFGIPIKVDKKCPPGTFYLINEEYCEMEKKNMSENNERETFGILVTIEAKSGPTCIYGQHDFKNIDIILSLISFALLSRSVWLLSIHVNV